LRTHRADLALRTLWTHVALRALRTHRADLALRSLRAHGANVAGVALLTLRTLREHMTDL
jgi:hypothetical protein